MEYYAFIYVYSNRSYPMVINIENDYNVFLSKYNLTVLSKDSKRYESLRHNLNVIGGLELENDELNIVYCNGYSPLRIAINDNMIPEDTNISNPIIYIVKLKYGDPLGQITNCIAKTYI